MRRFRAARPQVEPVSAVGSGDVLLAGVHRRAGSRAGRPRRRSATPSRPGAASTLEIGAGRFEPRDAAPPPARRRGRADRRSRRPSGDAKLSLLGRAGARSDRGRAAPRARGEVRERGADVRRRPARPGRVRRAPERRLDAHAADARDRARDPDRLGGDGHGHRGAARDRARPGGRHRRRSTGTSRSRTRSPRSTRSSAPRRG